MNNSWIVENVPDQQMAYMRQNGPYGADNHHLMERLKAWAKAHQLVNNDAVIVGIALDDPHMTAASACRYDVGIIVTSTFVQDNSVQTRTLPGGRYAVFRAVHTEDGVREAWRKVLEQLPMLNMARDGRVIIERYRISEVAAGYCELCVPLAPRD
ncbi:MAG: GyrI-like domain-containing protein [Sporolactobacillus sp.]